MFPVDRHHIKTARRFAISVAQQKKLCRLTDPFLFAPVNCRRCTAILPAASIFYFHKYKILSIPGNQIYFTSFTAKIPFQYKKSLFFQKGSRLFFMAAAYFTLVDTQSDSLISYLCVGIFC